MKANTHAITYPQTNAVATPIIAVSILKLATVYTGARKCIDCAQSIIFCPSPTATRITHSKCISPNKIPRLNPSLFLFNSSIFSPLYNFLYLSNIELVTTLTELIAIAPPAIIGDKSHPVQGYNNPAAIGIPTEL